MKFQSASASIIGTSHKKRSLNRQDAYRLLERDGITVAVVCDGCGSSAHSEVGAVLTAEFVVNYCTTHFASKPFNGQELCDALCSYYDLIIKGTGTIFPAELTRETLLATIIGCIITPTQVVVFTAGDGAFMVNDEIVVIDQDNRPLFLAYNVYRDKHFTFSEKNYKPGTIDRILLATDGIMDLWPENDPMPTVNELFSNEEFFSDPNALAKYLAGKEELSDDTTIILLKDQ